MALLDDPKALAGVERLGSGVGNLAFEVQRTIGAVGDVIKQGLADAQAAGLDIERMQETIGAVEARDAEQALALSGEIYLFILGGGDDD